MSACNGPFWANLLLSLPKQCEVCLGNRLFNRAEISTDVFWTLCHSTNQISSIPKHRGVYRRKKTDRFVVKSPSVITANITQRLNDKAGWSFSHSICAIIYYFIIRSEPFFPPIQRAVPEHPLWSSGATIDPCGMPGLWSFPLQRKWRVVADIT